MPSQSSSSFGRHASVTKQLLAVRCNIHLQDKSGRTVLQVAELPDDRHSGWNSNIATLIRNKRVDTPLLGRRVIINGLVAKPELNGRTGTAVSFNDDKGRSSVELDGNSSSLLIKPCNLSLTVCQAWFCVSCFHICIRYQGSLDVLILLQASPEQTKKQQEDADRAMKENHQKSVTVRAGESVAMTGVQLSHAVIQGDAAMNELLEEEEKAAGAPAAASHKKKQARAAKAPPPLRADVEQTTCIVSAAAASAEAEALFMSKFGSLHA